MNPDDLLAQIKDLLDQYLALGPNTPVAAEAQAFGASIDQALGGDQPTPGDPNDPMGQGAPPPAGGMPPDQAPMTSGQTPVPDMTGGMPLDQQQSGGYTDFGSAKAALAEAMKKKMTKAP